MALSANSAISTRVVIVEDHDMVREMLSRLLTTQEDISVVGAASTIAESKAAVRQAQPDMVLMDVVLPDGSGIDCARDLKACNPGLSVLFLTAVDEENAVIEAISSGAEGFLLKSTSCEGLIHTIRAVASGKRIYDPAATASILQRLAMDHVHTATTSTTLAVGNLSAKERQIVDLVSQGLSNKEIADATSTSLNTVKTHMRRIFRRLGVSSRKELL